MRLAGSRFVRRACGLACWGACLLGVVTQSALAQIIASPGVPPARTFLFDRGFKSSPPSLQFQFSRSVPTVNPDGTPVAANSPRFADESTIASAPVFEQVRPSSVLMEVIASGLDHDGVTPLLVTYEHRVPGYVDVFVGAGDAVLHAEQTGEGRVRTIITNGTDIMNGAITGRRYTLISGVVCHGLIVLFCRVTSFDAAAQVWRDSAEAFIASQDTGHTWTLVYESPPFTPGYSRGSPWCMQNWWPVKRGVPPQEAYFAATDYCFNPGSPGGRFFIMRARRDAAGLPWSLEPATIAYAISGNPGVHFHSGGVIPYGDVGIRAFVALGDLRSRNAIISLINPQGDYLSGNWDILDHYHGAVGTPGIEGNQFVGCAPGPFESSALVGSDINSEQVMLLSMPEDAPHPTTRRLVGLSATDGVGNNTFVIRTPTPELGGPYCAATVPYFSPSVPLSQRSLYSPDGLHWAQAATPPSGYPIIHGPHIYFDGRAGQGLLRVDVPNVVIAHPLLIGPGGLQQSRLEPTLTNGSPARVTPLSRNAQGLWADNGVVLDPQPPTLGPVYKVHTTIDDASPWIARLYPAGLSNPLHQIAGDQVQVRLWVRFLDGARTGTLSIGIGDATAAPQIYRKGNAITNTQWQPIIDADSIPLAANGAYQLYIRCSETPCDDQEFYIALDTLSEGRGTPGYPMPPDTSTPPTGTPNPDEVARVTGFGCAGAWTVTLALEMTEDGFDVRSALQSEWPLATLWANDQNYIELYATTTSSKIGMRQTVKGRLVRTVTVDSGAFIRGSTILLSVAQPPGNAGLELTASSGGLGFASVVGTQTSAGSTQRTLFAPREIRFASPTPFPSSSGRGSAVSPLLVWGGQIDERRALPKSQREQLLRSLSFLRPPVR